MGIFAVALAIQVGIGHHILEPDGRDDAHIHGEKIQAHKESSATGDGLFLSLVPSLVFLWGTGQLCGSVFRLFDGNKMPLSPRSFREERDCRKKSDNLTNI